MKKKDMAGIEPTSTDTARPHPNPEGLISNFEVSTGNRTQSDQFVADHVSITNHRDILRSCWELNPDYNADNEVPLPLDHRTCEHI